MKKQIVDRISSLRDYMRANGLSAYIVPSSDPHSSEYVADCWKSREWITGFDGSAGTAVIMLDDAALWTDSRYWLAADEVLQGTGVVLMKDGAEGTPSLINWIAAKLSAGDVVAVDGKVCSVVEVEAWQEAFASKSITVNSSHDAFEQLWSDRPAVPMSIAEIMPLERVGLSAREKVAMLQQQLSEAGADAMRYRC